MLTGTIDEVVVTKESRYHLPAHVLENNNSIEEIIHSSSTKEPQSNTVSIKTIQLTRLKAQREQRVPWVSDNFVCSFWDADSIREHLCYSIESLHKEACWINSLM